MSEIEKIKKILLYNKENLPYRTKEQLSYRGGYLAALRAVLNIFGEHPYFEISEEAKSFRASSGSAEDS